MLGYFAFPNSKIWTAQSFLSNVQFSVVCFLAGFPFPKKMSLSLFPFFCATQRLEDFKFKVPAVPDNDLFVIFCN